MEGIDINEKIICQSCGMPMKKQEDFGTDEFGNQNREYCNFCFQNGKFLDDCTLNEKIDKLVEISIKELGLKEDIARNMAETKLPQLKRWKNEI